MSEQNPVFLPPNMDTAICFFCGERFPAADADGFDVSGDDEYYPEMKPVCPSCGDGDE